MADGSEQITEIEAGPGVRQQWVVGPTSISEAEFSPDVTPAITAVSDAEQNINGSSITIAFLGVSNAENYPDELHWQGVVIDRGLFEEMLDTYLSNPDDWDDETAMLDLASQLMPDRTWDSVNGISLSEHVSDEDEFLE